MTLVVDASAVVAALVDVGEVGRWAVDRLADDHLIAPQLMMVEASNILRRAELGSDLSSDSAGLAYLDLLDLPVELFPFDPFADRIWKLRKTVTAYDAWYVAIAEGFRAKLVTLDRRLANATGPECGFLTPQGTGS